MVYTKEAMGNGVLIVILAEQSKRTRENLTQNQAAEGNGSASLAPQS